MSKTITGLGAKEAKFVAVWHPGKSLKFSPGVQSLSGEAGRWRGKNYVCSRGKDR